jgi:hypothetical protein
LGKTSNLFTQAVKRSCVSEKELPIFKITRRAALFESHLDKVDWKLLSYNRSLFPEFFRKHEDKVNWANISSNPLIPIELLEKHKKELNFYLIMQNKIVPIEFFENYQTRHTNWFSIIMFHRFNSRIFEKHFNLEALCQNDDITVDLVEKYRKRAGGLSELCYTYLSGHNSIPLDYIPRDKICWFRVFSHRALTLEFLETNIDKIELHDVWEDMCDNKDVSIEFLERHLDKIKNFWSDLTANTALPLEFFERHLEEINSDEKAVMLLSRNTTIPIEFFEKHVRTASWSKVLQWSKLSREFLERNLDRLDWGAISGNETTPIMFLEEHLDKIDWRNFCFGYGAMLPGPSVTLAEVMSGVSAPLKKLKPG